MQINVRKRYDFYFKSFLRTIKLSLSGTIDVCTSWFIVTDIFSKPNNLKRFSFRNKPVRFSNKIATRANAVPRIHGKR